MSKKKTIYVYTEEDCDGVEVEYLTYERTGARKAKPSELTPERIAEFLDQDAENRNAHDFCGVHVKLLVMLKVYSCAKAIMLQLAERGGLQGLNGVCQ
jgi:hypothetical protein